MIPAYSGFKSKKVTLFRKFLSTNEMG